MSLDTADVGGLWSRLTTICAAVTTLAIYYYVGRTLGHSEYAHHNTYTLVVSTCLVALTPCGRSYSVDRWLAIRTTLRCKTDSPPERGPLWGIRLIAAQVSLIYFWSAYDKTSWAFLSGDRLESIFMDKFFGSDYPAMPGFHELMVFMSVTMVALDYALAVGLWFRGPRKWLIPAGIILHLAMFYALRVHTFSLNICLLYLAYVPPQMVHRIIDEISGSLPEPLCTK